MGRKSPPENQLRYRKAIIMLLSGKSASEVSAELSICISQLAEIRGNIFSLIQMNTKNKNVPHNPTVKQIHSFRPWLLPIVVQYFKEHPIVVNPELNLPFPRDCEELIERTFESFSRQ